VDVEETRSGLRVRGKLSLAVEKAREVLALMKDNVVRGLSIGFIPLASEPLDNGGRRYTECRLIEVSLTPFPANPAAQVETVRTAFKEAKEMDNLKVVEEKIAAVADEIRAELADVRQQVNAVDLRTQRGGGGAWHSAGMDFAREIVQKAQEYRGSFDSGGRMRFEISNPLLVRATRPATLPSEGSATIGQAEFAPISEFLSLIPTSPTGEASIVAVREANSSTWAAAAQVEGQAKQESTPVFESELLPVRTIATWIAVTKQLLDDVQGLEGFVRSRLEQTLMRKLEEQVLLGAGTGENLKGLMVQADTWTPPTFAFDRFGALLHAAMTVRQRGFIPSVVIVSPTDELTLRLTRDTTGQYVNAPAGLPRVIPSAAMSAGQFLVADVSQISLRMKQGVTIDIAEQHSDYFTKNMVAIRAELRCALVCFSPKALLKGTLQTSPAS
jgi:HK97 family phage major capsid protein